MTPERRENLVLGLKLAIAPAVLLVGLGVALLQGAPAPSPPDCSRSWPLPAADREQVLEGCGCPGHDLALTVLREATEPMPVSPHSEPERVVAEKVQAALGIGQHPANKVTRSFAWALADGSGRRPLGPNPNALEGNGLPAAAWGLQGEGMTVAVGCGEGLLLAAFSDVLSAYDLGDGHHVYTRRLKRSVRNRAAAGELRCQPFPVQDGVARLPNSVLHEAPDTLRVRDGEFLND